MKKLKDVTRFTDLSEYKKTTDNLLNAGVMFMENSISRGETASSLVRTIEGFLE